MAVAHKLKTLAGILASVVGFVSVSNANLPEVKDPHISGKSYEALENIPYERTFYSGTIVDRYYKDGKLILELHYKKCDDGKIDPVPTIIPYSSKDSKHKRYIDNVLQDKLAPVFHKMEGPIFPNCR